MRPLPLLVLKTGALGDVLRTTSILPGLRAAHPGAEVWWLTAETAADLVRHHPGVDRCVTVDPRSEADVERAAGELSAHRFGWVISLDDEEPLCRLASALDAERLSGAHQDEAGRRVYTPDVAPWFDMGLLSVHGKEAADRMKVENERSHPAIFADMLGIRMGRPELPLSEPARAFGRAFAERHGLGEDVVAVGLNTGAGGRWTSKQLAVERTVELARLLARELPGEPAFVVLGGPDEAERNARIVSSLRRHEGELRAVDAGTENSLLEFAAIVDRLDLLVTSDSLALHVAVAREVPVVAFFAPTSAAEIELFGRGEAVRSTAPDYCSYRPDADRETITAERLRDAALRVLERHPTGRRRSRS